MRAPHHHRPPGARGGAHPHDPAPDGGRRGPVSAAFERGAAGAPESELGHSAGQFYGPAGALERPGDRPGGLAVHAFGGGEGHPPHLSRHRPGRAAGGPGADAAQHRGHRPGPGAAGGGGHPVSGRIRRPHVRPPPDGPDDQRHDPGGRVALQPEVPALLCRRAGPGPAAGADHGPVEGPSGEAPPGQYPPGDLHRRRAHPAAGPGGAGGGGPVVRHPAEHQRPPADAGAVPGSVRGQPGQRPGDSVRCRRRRSQRPGGGGGLR